MCVVFVWLVHSILYDCIMTASWLHPDCILTASPHWSVWFKHYEEENGGQRNWRSFAPNHRQHVYLQKLKAVSEDLIFQHSQTELLIRSHGFVWNRWANHWLNHWSIKIIHVIWRPQLLTIVGHTQLSYYYIRVSINGGTLNHLLIDWIFPHKPSFFPSSYWGHAHFRKPPYGDVSKPMKLPYLGE